MESRRNIRARLEIVTDSRKPNHRASTVEVRQADTSLALVSAAAPGETPLNRLKLLDCVGVSPAGNTRGGR
jgi:hypothetical protein